jgi:hypothetical protein
VVITYAIGSFDRYSINQKRKIRSIGQ